MPTKQKTAKKPATKAVKKRAVPARSATQAPSKKPSQAPTKKPAPRADFGKPIDSFFDKQPPALRAVLLELRAMVEATAPDATASIKWGMPFFQIGGNMFVALGAHKSHVNLILAGAPSMFVDPMGRLTGDGKTGRRLKLSHIKELPHEHVRLWLAAAAKVARGKQR
jgi:hypothetical protein